MALDNLVAAARENPVVLLIALLVPVLLLAVQSAAPAGSSKPLVNLSVQKENPKVVTKIDGNNLESDPGFKDGKLVLCRCWRSKKFPYCDGSHTAHNKETGDNVGPLIIEKTVQ